ncbi:MAG: AAA family ATPase [Chlorobaculum sp.]|nr:AAA family ATPase [Chlorobaculum sp.]
MILKSIRLENFRIIEEAQLDLGRRLTLFSGANGSGKTSVMEGLSITLGSVLTHLPEVSGRAFSKTGEEIRQFENKKAPYCRISIETVQGLKWDRMQKRDKSRNTARLLPSDGFGVRELHRYVDGEMIDPINRDERFLLPVFAFYGVSRALLNPPYTRKGFPKTHKRLEALQGALEASVSFKSAFIWFYNKENEEFRHKQAEQSFEVTLKELDTVRRAIAGMFPDISEPHIEVNPLRFVVRQGAELLDIMQLSDGYKTLLALVIDLSRRMAMANPHLDDPLSAEAVVMIDEIDLHLHPSWQQRVIGDLLKTFPNTQFIVTTHSPYIIESANNNLKRHQIRNRSIESEDIRRLVPLDPADTSAYFMRGKEGIESLMDTELGLLDDRLIEPFNQMTMLFDRMRDIEWGESQ